MTPKPLHHLGLAALHLAWMASPAVAQLEDPLAPPPPSTVQLPPPAIAGADDPLPTPPPPPPPGEDGPAVEPVPPPEEPLAPPMIPGSPGSQAFPAPPTSPGTPTTDSATPPPPQTPPISASDEGFLIKDAELNDLFQFLAKQAGRQYFHNTRITGPDYRVTGHLNDGNPLQQMEELAFMYGLMLYTKGNTVYALTQTQLSQLPSTEFTYQLRYLRPSDIAEITKVIQSVLSPGTGIVNFEPKTNTIIIIDTAHKIDQARTLLHSLDKPKGQIIVETKIFRINSTAAERLGVSWEASLGQNGTPLEIARSLNSVFGIDSDFASSPQGTGTFGQALNTLEAMAGENLVLSPIQANGVLRALAQGGFATQISNPTMITEDNEQGNISIIDRVPIITTTTNQGNTGQILNATEEVRYKIDPSDPTIVDDPQNHREIGVSMVVTPTLLPDGTIRMNLRPRSAQVTDVIVSVQTGNEYPRVTESMIDSITRVPDGHTLVLGGFYGEVERKDRNKVPLLGDIPVINFFFKSKETVKEQSSLVFMVTPTSYDPGSVAQTGTQSNRIHSALNLTRDYDWVDPQHNPGPAHEPNLRRGIRGLKPQEAPYYPTADEATPQKVEHHSSKTRFSRTRQ